MAPPERLGPVGEARETHLQDYHSSPFEHKGVCDEWFVDDEQCFVRPLTCGFALWTPPWPPSGPPAAVLRMATSRDQFGSSAHTDRTRDFLGWDIPYVHNTVTVLS